MNGMVGGGRSRAAVFGRAALAGAAAALLLGSEAQADRIAEGPDPAPAGALKEPGRPHLEAGALYWSDHELSQLCRVAGGRFAKLAGSAVYACTPPGQASTGEGGS